VAGSAVDRGRDLVGEDTVDLVDSEEVVAAEAVDHDVRDVRALEAEVRRTVVTDIDLEGAGIVCLETKSDFVAGRSARLGPHPANRLRALEVVDAHRTVPHCETGGRDRVPPAAEVGQSRARSLAGFRVPAEAIERVAVVRHLQTAVPAPCRAQKTLPGRGDC